MCVCREELALKRPHFYAWLVEPGTVCGGKPGRVIHTPGHTMGSLSIVLESGEAFVGDLVMNFGFMRRGPGLPLFAEDVNLVVKSWKKLLDSGVKMIYPAHGKPFPVALLEKLAA